MKNKVIVICGFSASGKDSICKYISDNYNYKMVISHTSRPIRSYELEGNPYYFVSKEQFENMINNHEFIECRTYNTLINNNPDTWYYGVHKNSIDLSKNNYIVVLDIKGLVEFKKHFKENIISFFIDVDEPTRKQRCINRKDFDDTEWVRRWEDDKINFTTKMINQEVNYIVLNNNIDKCVNEIINKIGEV
jgi:guanylate kinase